MYFQLQALSTFQLELIKFVHIGMCIDNKCRLSAQDLAWGLWRLTAVQLQKVSKLHVGRYAVVYLLSIVRNESTSAAHLIGMPLEFISAYCPLQYVLSRCVCVLCIMQALSCWKVHLLP